MTKMGRAIWTASERWGFCLTAKQKTFNMGQVSHFNSRDYTGALIIFETAMRPQTAFQP